MYKIINEKLNVNWIEFKLKDEIARNKSNALDIEPKNYGRRVN